MIASVNNISVPPSTDKKRVPPSTDNIFKQLFVNYLLYVRYCAKCSVYVYVCKIPNIPFSQQIY